MITKLLKNLSSSIRLIEIIEEAPETFTFKFLYPENIKWKPGSYAHFISSNFRNGEKMNRNLMRELSIMTHPDENKLGFTTRIRENPSDFKKKLKELKIGNEIQMFKIGNHLKAPNTNRPIVLITMGVGIATLRPIVLEYLANAKANSFITNINIDRSGNFVYKAEFEQFASDKIKNCFVTNRADFHKRINESLDNPENVYYVVGSNEFNQTTRKYLLENDVDKKTIFFDRR